MFLLKRFSIICLLFLSFGPVVWSQTLPTTPAVFVSGGPPTGTCNSGVTFCTIYVQNGAAFTPVLTQPAANFESLAIGPDNVDTDAAGNAAHPFLLYACDTAGKTIIRFDPTVATITTQSVTPTLVITPVCGRSTATGHFYVTNKLGPGVYDLIAPSQVPLANVLYSESSIGASATQIDSFTGMTGRGITQKYTGDLLAVDNGHNQVLHSAYTAPPLFTTLLPLITTNLNGPTGVANAPSLRQIFVSNSNSLTQSAITIFDANGAPSTTTCPSGLSLPSNNKQIPNYLATAPTDQFSATGNANTVITDTIYLVTNSNNAGTLWTWNAVAQAPNCSLVAAATAKAPLSGVAVAPAPVTLTLPEIGSSTNPVPTPFFFNSSLFQFTATGCNATVTAYPRSLATIQSMISLAGKGGPPPTQFPAVGLGDGGFETAYVSNNSQCGPVLGGVLMGIFNFTDANQYTNPRVLDCHNNGPLTEPQLIGGDTTCFVPDTIGVYPLGGPIPKDGGTIVGGRTSNFFAVVNENAGPGTPEPGDFCGFQSPLLNPTDPGYPFSFAAGSRSTINVKFKLSSSNCKKDFITDATALISVAQLSPVFNAVNVQPTSNSLIVPPIFNEGNSQYAFTLNVSTLPPGTYSLTVTFLTDNATSKTILFVIT